MLFQLNYDRLRLAKLHCQVLPLLILEYHFGDSLLAALRQLLTLPLTTLELRDASLGLLELDAELVELVAEVALVFLRLGEVCTRLGLCFLEEDDFVHEFYLCHLALRQHLL